MEGTTGRIAVVIAAFNEAAMIGQVVSEVCLHADQVIVVDDGSTDDTGRIAASSGALVIRHALNRGQGAALQTGISAALRSGADYVVTFDADGQHRASEIPQLLAPLKSGAAEVVLGSRFLTDSQIPLTRRVVLRMATIMTRLMSGVAVTDTHNGFRGFNRRAAAMIEITQDRMAHASEILDELRRLDLQFVEVPVTIRYSDYSRRKGQSSLDAFRVLFDYIVGRWTR